MPVATRSVSTSAVDAHRQKWHEMMARQKRQRAVRDSFRNIKGSQLDMRKFFPPLVKSNCPSDRDYRILRERLKKLAFKQKEALHEFHENINTERNIDQLGRNLLLQGVHTLNKKYHLETFRPPREVIAVYDLVQELADAFIPWANYYVQNETVVAGDEKFWNIGPFWNALCKWPRLQRLVTLHQLIVRLEQLDGELEKLVEPFGVRCTQHNPLYEYRLAEGLVAQDPWLQEISLVELLLEKFEPLVEQVITLKGQEVQSPPMSHHFAHPPAYEESYESIGPQQITDPTGSPYMDFIPQPPPSFEPQQRLIRATIYPAGSNLQQPHRDQPNLYHTYDLSEVMDVPQSLPPSTPGHYESWTSNALLPPTTVFKPIYQQTPQTPAIQTAEMIGYQGADFQFSATPAVLSEEEIQQPPHITRGFGAIRRIEDPPKQHSLWNSMKQTLFKNWTNRSETNCASPSSFC